MDLTFGTPYGNFNYRVCAIVLKGRNVLITRKKDQPYYYFPGGRVKMYETAEDALLRELEEELGTDFCILRPLWLIQSFYTESVHDINYHEICLCFLVNLSEGSDLLYQQRFWKEENGKEYEYCWCTFDQLKDYLVHPRVLKEKLDNLPESIELISVNTIEANID